MKKTLNHVLALMLACIMMASAFTAVAYAADDNTLVVASTTKMSGNFFSDLWGNNTSDIDVRMLLHGYNLVKWDSEFAAYGVDDSVVHTVVVTENPKGDRTYNLYLYDNLYYSDGTQITAWDYAFSFLIQSTPQMQEIGAAIHNTDYIEGLTEYINGEVDYISGVKVKSDFMLSVTLKAEYLPYYYELALLSVNPYPISQILPGCEVMDDLRGVQIVDKDSKELTLLSAQALKETLLDAETGYVSHPSVVSGPYKLVSYDKAAGVAEFEINEYYKGNQARQKPSIQKIVFKHVTSDQAIEQLKNGEIDLVNKLMSLEQLDAGLELTAEENFAVSNYPREGFGFVSFNCEQEYISDVNVRQAIAYSFDKNEFVSEYLRNYGARVDGYYGIGQWIYQMVEGIMEPPVDTPAEGASEKELQDYADEVAKWDALSLDNIKRYELDYAKANELLNATEWTKNEAGGEFDGEADSYRYRSTDGALECLELDMIYPAGNAAGERVAETLKANLENVGIKLNYEAVDFNELLVKYYRQGERDVDMIYLASNFQAVFDPSETFSVEDAPYGYANRTGIADEKLDALASDMAHTHPNDMLGYLTKWVAFQEYWTECLPALPLYSNVYFDFYTAELEDYNINGNPSWTSAIVGATLKGAE